MRRLTVALVISLAVLSSLAGAQTAPPSAASSGQAAAKSADGPDKAMLAEVLDAWASMNLENVKKYYDQAPGDVFYDIAPLKYDGFAKYAAGAKEMFSTLSSLKFTLNDDAVTHKAGTLAWSTATVRTAMTEKAGKTTNVDCRWTVIWQRKTAGWVIVHDHFSASMEPPK